MKMKKLAAFAVAAVMAVGICVGVPGVPSAAVTLTYTDDGSVELGLGFDKMEYNLLATYTTGDFEIKEWRIDFYLGDNFLYSYFYKEVSGYSGKGGDIVIPDGVGGVDEDVFKDNNTITSVTFPESCDYVGSSAFENCKKLKSVTFKGDNGLNSGLGGAFKGCTSLKSVIIEGNAFFGSEMFMNCTSLESVIVKGKINAIQDSAFENCTSLKTFKIYKMDTVYDKTWQIEKKAFKNCKNLTSITIPNNCRYIGKEAFKNCISLETVKISGKWNATDNTGKIITGGAAYDFHIQESAFENCYSLKSINLLKRTYEIEEKAFLNCYSLSELKIPKEGIWLRDYSVGYIYSGGKYSVADGKKTVTYTNADGEKVTVKPKQITLTVPYLSNAECYYANKNNIKYKYTDGTSPSSIPAPESTKIWVWDDYGTTTYLTIDTSDGADFYRIYKFNYDTDKFEFYKDVTSANNLEVTYGTYVVVAYYKDKNGNYTTSRPTDLL